MSTKLKVLFVEDNIDDADLLKLHLKKSEYDIESDIVFTAKSFENAIEQNNWDLILSDYEMPGFGGMEALEILKKSGKDIPFILVSGTVGEEIAVESVLAGANDYMLKDNLTRLSTSIDRELRSKKLRDEKLKKDIALRKSEKQFEQLFKHSIDGIIIANYNGTITAANDAACKILGYSENEMKNLTREGLVDLTDPEVRKAYDIRDEQKFYTGKLKLRHKSGNLIPVEVSTQLYEVFEHKYQTSTIFRDISDRLKAEEELRESLKEKEVMLSEVHHRVKNNMAIVSGLLSLQADSQEDIKFKELLLQSISRIQSIAAVHEMLYSSESFSNIALDHYISDLIEKISQNYSVESNIDFEVDAESVNLSMTYAIPFGLIINELITNALKHAYKNRENGKITVNMTQDDNLVKLVVKDDGVGVSDISQLKESGKLGLTIVNALVDQLKASIDIQNNQGLSYTITVPVDK